MDAYEAILGKRDTREYDGRAIPDNVVRQLLQAGRMAGSSKNGQPLRFIVVRGRDQKRALAGCGDFTDHLPASPLVIVIVRFEGSRPFDAGRAAQNMMVAAHALGIASCPVGIQHDDRAHAVLGTPPNTVMAMAITFGYPVGGRALARGDRRLPLEEIARWERWDVTSP